MDARWLIPLSIVAVMIVSGCATQPAANTPPQELPKNYRCSDGTMAINSSMCPAFCGDGICNSGETCETCPRDCGQCVAFSFKSDPHFYGAAQQMGGGFRYYVLKQYNVGYCTALKSGIMDSTSGGMNPYVITVPFVINHNARNITASLFCSGVSGGSQLFAPISLHYTNRTLFSCDRPCLTSEDDYPGWGQRVVNAYAGDTGNISVIFYFENATFTDQAMASCELHINVEDPAQTDTTQLCNVLLLDDIGNPNGHANFTEETRPSLA